MSNRRQLFVDTSDFFHTRKGVLGPRSAQLEIGRTAVGLVRRHLDARRADLPRLVHDPLQPLSSWPDAGNMLVREHLRDVLVAPDTPTKVHATVDAIIARAVLAGARQRYSTIARTRFRRHAMRVLSHEIGRRRLSRRGASADLLDAVVLGAEQSSSVADLAEVYLSTLFAAVGSIGFALGWSVYLAGRHGEDGDEPAWIVREALRLWPVAWLFARTAKQAHHLAGTLIKSRDEAVVCTYLVHRHPDYWDSPDSYLPRRWATSAPAPAFMPFGFGPHTCAGAAVATSFLEDLVEVLTRDRHLSVAARSEAPLVGPALAPPQFTIRLNVRSREGG
jgi:cytochrome P450